MADIIRFRMPWHEYLDVSEADYDQVSEKIMSSLNDLMEEVADDFQCNHLDAASTVSGHTMAVLLGLGHAGLGGDLDDASSRLRDMTNAMIRFAEKMDDDDDDDDGDDDD